MEVVTFPLELCGSVDLVSHDSGDGLLDVLHPLGHLGVAHLVDLLDEVVIFLPERHLGFVLGCLSVLKMFPTIKFFLKHRNIFHQSKNIV